MNILIVGNGGREHALGWKLKQDPRVKRLFFAPGNGGTCELGENVNIIANDLDGIVEWTRAQHPDLVVIGPEAPLCAGLSDRLTTLGVEVFGPNQRAAQLEGSKHFAKTILERAGIPTGRFKTFTRVEEALAYSQTQHYPQVIKASGLAAGKGVIIAQNPWEASAAIYDLMCNKLFGAAGDEVLIEEFLEGEEMSVHAVTDGQTFRLLPSAQDHKRISEGDTGPNTGGMGAYAPSPRMTAELATTLKGQIFEPLLEAMKDDGIDYRGVLYAGLMLTADGPKVLEFNCRFGDPEAQVLLPLLQTPLLDIMLACVRRKLGNLQVEWSSQHALGVVMASEGYPANPRTGEVIEGLDHPTSSDQQLIFHAGTKRQGDKMVASGGRVLTLVGLGSTLREARDQAYRCVGTIHFRGAQFRRDIGHRAL